MNMNFELITVLISIVLILITGIWYYVTINTDEPKDDVIVKHENCLKKVGKKYVRHQACERPCSSNNTDNIIEIKVPKKVVAEDKEKTKCHKIKWPEKNRCITNLDCKWDDVLKVCNNKSTYIEEIDICSEHTSESECKNNCEWIKDSNDDNDDNVGLCYTPVDNINFEFEETLTKVVDLEKLTGQKKCTEFCNDCTVLTVNGKYK